ncbi:hypothetical protein BOW53_14460 [Solemya pervernicosa gill symbiont]|uniref:Uncharacterized protein n=2 Tax=Gammaproteobacteria incertae sedis TaxID=118884 RepID=A0A1T2L0T7_9GAMM|nr:hypothetical protein [Candidatus Reidiella endopervernicosa]OOZ38723.1 hypothetical protein BOW53_14460 [Solemya pervernicosa gill symbiont]
MALGILENNFCNQIESMDPINCPFEKTILSRRGNCECADRFYIAEREGVGCEQLEASNQCRALIAVLRENARFTLKIVGSAENLPHGQEMKVQCGGLLGLQALVESEELQEQVANIHSLAEELLAEYDEFESVPYGSVVKSMAAYEHRQRRSRR